MLVDGSLAQFETRCLLCCRASQMDSPYFVWCLSIGLFISEFLQKISQLVCCMALKLEPEGMCICILANSYYWSAMLEI